MSSNAPNVRPLRPAAAKPDAAATCAPLAELNAYIRQVTAARKSSAGTGTEAETGAGPHELSSVRRFRRAWESGRVQERLDQALARKPANAGPLNSHALVLRSLAWMNALSPDYLRRFMAHAEALQWLEATREALPREAARTAAKPAAKAPRKPRAARPPASPT